MTQAAVKNMWLILGVVGAVAAVIIFHPILILIFMAFLLTLALHPAVEWLKRHGVPRTVSVLVMVALFLGAVAAAVILLGPELVAQVKVMIEQAPERLQQAEERFGFILYDERMIEHALSVLRDAGSVFFNVATAIFALVTSFVIVVVLSLYWLIYYDEIKEGALSLVPKNKQRVATAIAGNIEKNLKAWVIGQLVLCIIVGLLVWLAYTIIGLPFALPLAALAAVLEIVPNLGPVLAAIPAILVGLGISPTMALTVLVAYVVIQHIESYLLTPRIMSKVTRLNPFVVIVSILVGAHLLGIIGAFLAVPILLLIISIKKGVQQSRA